MLSISTQIAKDDDLQVFLKMLDSASFADQIVIYAMDRHDQEFRQAVKKYRPQIIDIATPSIVEQIRDKQVHDAPGEWVLIMDYDEVISPALANEIKQIMHRAKSHVAYKIRRRNYSLGFPMSHGGFGDDYVHRLFYRSDFVSWPHEIHATPQVNGNIGTLDSIMEHHKDSSIAQMVEKTNRYSDVEAQQFLDGGLPPVTVVTLVRKPVMEFIRRYVIKRGYLDGRIGMLQSIYQAFSVFITYAKLYEKQQKSNQVEHNI